MHISNGGAHAPRKTYGAEARRRLDLDLQAATYRATDGLPGVKPDRVYEIRAGRAKPWGKLVAALEQLQDVGVPVEADVIPLNLIRAYLAERRTAQATTQKAA